MKKTKKVKAAKRKVKRVKKPKVKVSRKTTQKLIKNPVIYFDCMKSCCQAGISPKKISQVAHECKTNALAVKKKVSAEKMKDLKKLGDSFNEFKQNLSEFVKKSVR